MYLLTFLIQILLLQYALGESVTVTFPLGQIRGKTVQSSCTKSRTYWGFYGVPYAEPPVGKYRFQAPAAKQAWHGVYEATYERGICHSTFASSGETEDCLHLNIFSPRHPLDAKSALLPVMFHIHGGGFNQGSGRVNSGFGPDFFMDYGVVIVSINYRLNAFGFLSTGDSVIPGNAGLKDQLLALEWVNKYIKYFGGDPTKVTIFGESAGSASVSYHLLSPKSKGLFHAAIMQSGSALSPWAYQRNMKYYTHLTAGLVNPSFNASGVTSHTLLAHLQAADANAIDAAATHLQNINTMDTNQILQGFYYAPVIEPASNEAFITQHMYELFESGQYNKVPVLLGTNTDEGLLLYGSYTHSTLQNYDSNPKYLVPHDMHVAESQRASIGKLITKQYVHSNWQSNLPAGIQYFTDTGFARSLLKQAALQSKFNDVYFYIFSYHGKMGMNPVQVAGTNNVTHGEEVPYLFTRISNGINNANVAQFSQSDQNTHYRMMKFWTNFAIHHNPVPKTDSLIEVQWPKVTTSSFHYMNIGKNLVAGINPKGEIYQFWTKLYTTHGVRPFDTY